MTRILFLFIVLTVSSMAFYSCQKEISDPNGSTSTPSTASGDFRAKINGVQWVASSSSASKLSGFISIAGTGSGKLIVMTLQDSGVHHYTLNQTSMQAGAYSDSASGSNIAFTTNGGSTPSQSGGSVDITSIDIVNKKISGTFRFTVYRPIDSTQRSITEGSFTNVSYATTTPPASSTDSFRVKTDGVPFTAFSVLNNHLTMGNQITISGTDQGGTKTVGVLLPDNATPGTYQITGVLGMYSGTYNSDAITYFASDTGTIQVLENNLTTKRLRGNFNFHAKQFPLGTMESQLTEGYFSVIYH